LAQEGYLVVEPNYRGSSGYGEKFRNLNVEDSGGGETDDVAAGVKYVVDRGLADPKHVAIGGGSHGGTMVAYAVTKYPALFQAAIEMYGVVDRTTFLERTNRNSAVRWAMKMGGTPSEKPEVYLHANSLAKVKEIQTPLLVLHGENDPQVPPYESSQFAKALRQNNKVLLLHLSRRVARLRAAGTPPGRLAKRAGFPCKIHQASLRCQQYGYRRFIRCGSYSNSK
jgi:dipeptidyl aminopeptidase/acylaminoacyl peptidase